MRRAARVGSADERPAGRVAVVLVLLLWGALAALALALALGGGAREAVAQEAGTSGKAAAWGYNFYGQTDIPLAAQSGVKAIAGGHYHSLALKEDDSAVAWGYNDYGQTDVPSGLKEPEAVAGGFWHSLVLDVPTPPGPVDLFEAVAGEGQTSLSWSNPTAPDFQAVRVLRSTAGPATSPTPDADQVQVYEGTGESFEDTGLANGTTYYYTVYATDDAGLWSARATRRATPDDATAPDTTLDSSGPSGLVNSTSAAFDFASPEEGSTFECSLDSAPFAACDPGIGYTSLSEGLHSFGVRAVDAAGSHDDTPATRSWTVDATAPPAPAITDPASDTRDTDGSFVVSGTAQPGTLVRLYEETTRVGTDEADSQSGAWRVAVSEAPEGSHSYSAQAADAAGNASAWSNTVRVIVDTTGPSVGATSPTSGARGVAIRANVTATFSEAMRAASLTGSTFKLVKAGTRRAVSATVSYDAERKKATLDPSAKLAKETRYTATVTSGAKDLAGNRLDQSKAHSGEQPKTWSFVTAR